MAEEQQHQHHHHHHHHRMDGASKFKYKQLRNIELQRKFEKYGLRAACILAIAMVLIVIVCYAFL